jgi:hypothetical protein
MGVRVSLENATQTQRGDRNAMWIEKYCLIPSGSA